MRFSKVAMVLVTGAMMFNIAGCNLGAVLGAQAEVTLGDQALAVLGSVEATVLGLSPDVLDVAVVGWFDLAEVAVGDWVANQVPGGA